MVKSTMDVVDDAMNSIMRGESILQSDSSTELSTDDIKNMALVCHHTTNKIKRKLNTIKNLKLTKTKDEVYKSNKIKSLEVRVIRYALDKGQENEKRGLFDFPAIFDKRWLECAKSRGYERAKPWFDEDKNKFIEKNTITED